VLECWYRKAESGQMKRKEECERKKTMDGGRMVPASGRRAFLMNGRTMARYY